MMTIRTTAVPALLASALTLGSAFAGDIVGKVKYAGTAPAPAKIQVTKDQAVCGKAEHFDETLLVGPDKGVKNVVVNISDPKDGKKYTAAAKPTRSEEHTSELQSQSNLVCRLLLEKKKPRVTALDGEDSPA